MPPMPPAQFGLNAARAPTRAPGATPTGRSFDQVAVEKIEATRRAHSGCREVKARATGDVRRIDGETAAKLAEINERFGVDDVPALRALVTRERAAATERIDDYIVRVRAVTDALELLGEKV